MKFIDEFRQRGPALALSKQIATLDRKSVV